MAWADLSARLLRTCLKTFGMGRDEDGDVRVFYRRGGTDTELEDVVFDENFISVDPNTGAQIISDNPMIGVAAEDIPGGEWMQGDMVIIDGVQYRCYEPQKDSEGHIKIILHRMT